MRTPVICLFTDSLQPSGVGEHMLTLAAELRRMYQIKFVCPPTSAGKVVLERANALGIETYGFALRGLRGIPSARHRFGEWLHEQRVALCHVHAGIGWEGHAGVYAARGADVSVVRTEHLPDLITAPRLRDAYLRLIPAVDRFICVSAAAGDSFLQAGVPAEKLRVVQNGIARPPTHISKCAIRTRLGLPEHARIVLTVARFTAQKGYRYLLDAVPSVLARMEDAHFVWVGTGPLEGALRSTIARRGLEDRVRLVGHRLDVPELLAGSELFVLPSLFEGLPLVVLEAMAAGLSVVGTRVGGTTEAVEDGVTGRLVPTADSETLAAGIVEALQAPDLAARWGQAGSRRVVQFFSATRMANQTAALYEEVLAPTDVSHAPRRS